MPVHGKGFLLAILWLASAPSPGQVYKWTDEQGRVHYGASPPPGRTAQPLAHPAEGGAAAQPRSGVSGSVPATSLPAPTPAEVERRRRAIENMDRDDEERQRAALRDSPEGKRACAMMQARVRDAESGILRGQTGERRLTAEEREQVLPALRNEYDKSCR